MQLGFHAEETAVSGIPHALNSMRLPKQSKTPVDMKKDLQLAYKLASAGSSSGHGNFLSGIIVHTKITAPHYFWNQWQRYHFQQIISSTSKMHSLTVKPVKEYCTPYVVSATIDFIQELCDAFSTILDPEGGWKQIAKNICYNHDTQPQEYPTTRDGFFEFILDNLPMGYTLTAGVVTNYLQLKTMWFQRKNHRLSMWNTQFTNWVFDLPLSELIACNKKDLKALLESLEDE